MTQPTQLWTTVVLYWPAAGARGGGKSSGGEGGEPSTDMYR